MAVLAEKMFCFFLFGCRVPSPLPPTSEEPTCDRVKEPKNKASPAHLQTELLLLLL